MPEDAVSRPCDMLPIGFHITFLPQIGSLNINYFRNLITLTFKILSIALESACASLYFEPKL